MGKLTLLFTIVIAGCGGGPRTAVVRAVEGRDSREALLRYERFRADEGGGDPSLLARIAALVIEIEVESGGDTERSAGLHQLDLAGTEGLPVLDRLSRQSEHEVVRARALEILARRGDSGATAALRGMLDSEDAQVVAAAVTTLDATDDVDALLGYLTHTSGDVRSAAARTLRGSAPVGRARAALAEAARVDPLPSVRSAAVRSLGVYGPEAFEPLRERISDPDGAVRMAAVGALMSADGDRAAAVIAGLLEMTPTRAGIEAARVLADRSDAQQGAEGAVTARAFLRRALVATETDLRSQAAVALSSLRDTSGLDDVLAELLDGETEVRVRLAVAGILLHRPGHEAGGRAALEALLPAGDMPAIQAAALLAQDTGHRPARRTLARAMRSSEAELRRAAARALARDAMEPDAARRALRDPDAIVRIHAAGGILAAVAAA